MAVEDTSVEARLARLNRRMPFSDEAERGLLSCLLQDPERRIPECAARLPVEAIYHDANRIILQALYRMQETNVPVGPPSLTHVLADANQLDRVGGAIAVSDLFSFTPIPSQFPFFKGIVIRDYLRRKMIDACAAGIEDAMNYNDEEMEGEIPDARLMLDICQQRTFEVLQVAQGVQDGGEGPVKASKFMVGYIDHLERIWQNVGKVIGLHTGLPDVDRIICGLDDKRGEMLVVGARPGHGKTALLGTWLKNMCIDQGIPTLMFSMEMGTDQIMDRIVFGGFDINTGKARTGMTSHAEKMQIQKNIGRIAGTPLWIDESAEVNTVEFRSRVEMMVRLHGIKLLIVDYLQLIKPTTKIGRSEERLAISEALNMLHLLKRRHGLVILCAAQLNQNIEKTPGRRHVLSDFAGSDAIGKYADYAMFITRPSEVKRWKDLDDKRKLKEIERWKEHREAQPHLWAGWKVKDAVEVEPPSQSQAAFQAMADDDDDIPDFAAPKKKFAKQAPADESEAKERNTLIEVQREVRHGDGSTVWVRETWSFDNERDWEESAELQLVKNRNGPTPDIAIRFRREFARFDTRTPKLFSGKDEERQH